MACIWILWLVQHKSIPTSTVNSKILPCHSNLELGCSIRDQLGR